MPLDLKRKWLGYVIIAFLCLLAGLYLVEEIRTIRIMRQRAKQRRAVTEITMIANDIHAYMSAHEGCPPQLGKVATNTWSFSQLPSLQSQLEGAYLKNVPAEDPWGAKYLYGYNPQTHSFCLISLAKGGNRDSSSVPTASIETTCFENDIIWSGNSFVQSPRGKQQFCEGK